MDKIDLKKVHTELYRPPRKPEIVEVPVFQFLMIDGVGTTESQDFSKAIEALFGTSYRAKFLCKKQQERDYVVMPLEGLWWADDMDAFIAGDKENWKWTLMIQQPDFVTPEIVQIAKEELLKKKNLSQAEQLRLETFQEGLSAQMMHIGPFSEEGPNIEKIHALIEEKGGVFDGHLQKHHEIYLSDFRKVAPEKMKTVLRQSFILNH